MAASTNKSNKILQTRIQVKYDTYAKWIEKDPVLLAGEIAVATIANVEGASSQKYNSVPLPQVLIKVGDGNSKYSALPFVSGMAADVYGWAKLPEKPGYSAGEITGLKEYVESISDVDTNTTYQLVATDAATYKYELQGKNIGDSAWTKVSTLDLSGIDTRLDAVEASAKKANDDLKDYKEVVPTLISAAIESLDDQVTAQVASETNGWVSADLVQEDGIVKSLTVSLDGSKYAKADVLDGLDTTVTHTKGSDGLALSLTQTNGLVTAISGSIAANTYDAYGTASAAISALNGSISNNAINEVSSFGIVTSISEAEGIVTANQTTLSLTDNYSASNPIATKDYVDGHVADIMADIEGGMHFIGRVNEKPVDGAEGYNAGDVVVWGTIEYVYGSDNKWIELGDISQAQQMINASLEANNKLMTLNKSGSVAKTITTITQTDGKVDVVFSDIKIASDAVTHGENSTVKASLEDHATRLADVEEAIEGINTDFNTNVGDIVKVAIEALNDQVTPQVASETNGWVNADVVQSEGIVTSISVSIAADKYDAYGAASDVLGKSSDASTANTVYGAKKAAAEALAAAQKEAGDRAAAIEALDGSAVATSTSDGTINVLTSVTQSDGLIAKGGEVNISKVGQSGKVQDLIQDNNTYIILNCGTAEINID